VLAVAGTAEAILAAVVAWYADEAHGAEPLPERRYVAAGDPRAVAWDCDAGQVTVAFASSALQVRQDLAGPITQSPGGRNRSVQMMRSGSFELQVVRPTPQMGYEGEAPSAEVLSAHGISLLHDVEQVLAMVNDAQHRGRFLPEGHKPAPVQVPLVEVLGPTGNLAGIAVTVVVELL
jgi:hypothetical protein